MNGTGYGPTVSEKHWIVIVCCCVYQVPNSVLWLLRYSAEAEANILRTVVDLGLPAGRVVFSNLAPKVKDKLTALLKNLFE